MPSNGLVTRPITPLTTGTRERNVLATAFVVSLLLHVLGAALTWRLPLVPESDLQEHRRPADEVELILVDEDEERATDPEMPRTYTSIPERDASETPPEKADYLALRHSLAADDKLGDTDRPSAAVEDEVEQVAIQREDLSGAGGVAYAPTPIHRDEREGGGSPAAAAEQERREAQRGEPSGRLGEEALPDRQEAQDASEGNEQAARTGQKTGELADWWAGQAPSVLREGEDGAAGDRGFDFDQDARGSVTSGVSLVAPYRLNTYEWAFAPWMNRFVNELRRHWNPPYAYKLGLLEGETVLHMVVEKDGRLSKLEVLQTEGHASLHDASQAALRAFAPYAPLPPDFPEANLEIELTLIYPGQRR